MMICGVCIARKPPPCFTYLSSAGADHPHVSALFPPSDVVLYHWHDNHDHARCALLLGATNHGLLEPAGGGSRQPGSL